MVKLLQWCTRVAGVLALLLGILIGRVSYYWLPRTHIALGLVVVGALILISIAGFFARLSPALPIVGVIWAGAAWYMGIAQNTLVPGSAHWVIEAAHALLGLGAMGLADAIGARISRQRL